MCVIRNAITITVIPVIRNAEFIPALVDVPIVMNRILAVISTATSVTPSAGNTHVSADVRTVMFRTSAPAAVAIPVTPTNVPTRPVINRAVRLARHRMYAQIRVSARNVIRNLSR